jgi:Short C-terminal domain
MTQLSPKGARAVQEIADHSGFSPDAVTSMLLAVVVGHGRMAQFSHPEFGGSGQWMGGGAIMISDMFNNALKARVDALCVELAELIRSEPDFSPAFLQSQSQGERGNLGGQSSSFLAAEGRGQARWWSADLGSPASLGAQNDVRYAYFPEHRRLAIEMDGTVTIYDSQDHQISGFSQQQPGSRSPRFSSQLGDVDVSRLPVVSDASETKTSPEPRHEPASVHPAVKAKAAAGHDDTIAAIEGLAGLHARGILTDVEFSAKKAELLGRL